MNLVPSINMKPEQVECKQVNGRIVCKFGSGLITSTLPPIDPIPINIYTSKDCGWCEDAIKIVKKVTSPFKDVINLKVIDVNDGCDECDDIEILPTINIGRGSKQEKLLGVPRDNTVWTSLFRQLGTIQ